MTEPSYLTTGQGYWPDEPTPESEQLTLSKKQKIRKRELRRAMNLLHERMTESIGDPVKGMNVYGLRVAITILGEMRKEIDRERGERSTS